MHLSFSFVIEPILVCVRMNWTKLLVTFYFTLIDFLNHSMLFFLVGGNLSCRIGISYLNIDLCVCVCACVFVCQLHADSFYFFVHPSHRNHSTRIFVNFRSFVISTKLLRKKQLHRLYFLVNTFYWIDHQHTIFLVCYNRFFSINSGLPFMCRIVYSFLF